MRCLVGAPSGRESPIAEGVKNSKAFLVEEDRGRTFDLEEGAKDNNTVSS